MSFHTFDSHTFDSHTFDQRSWRIIKEFAGIYCIKMDYSKIAKLPCNKLSKAYFGDGNLPLFEEKVSLTAKLNAFGKLIWSPNDARNHRAAFAPKGAKEWKALILRRAAQGYKNRQFYEAVAKLLAPPPKVTCVCGLNIGAKEHQQTAHYRTRAHVNRMLKCVPLSKVADSTVPTWDQMGNSHTLVVRKWSNQQRRYLRKQVDLRPYMEQRERFNGTTCYTMDDILAGGWVPV
jgi:hypothetical protein